MAGREKKGKGRNGAKANRAFIGPRNRTDEAYRPNADRIQRLAPELVQQYLSEISWNRYHGLLNHSDFRKLGEASARKTYAIGKLKLKELKVKWAEATPDLKAQPDFDYVIPPDATGVLPHYPLHSRESIRELVVRVPFVGDRQLWRLAPWGKIEETPGSQPYYWQISEGLSEAVSGHLEWHLPCRQGYSPLEANRLFHQWVDAREEYATWINSYLEKHNREFLAQVTQERVLCGMSWEEAIKAAVSDESKLEQYYTDSALKLSGHLDSGIPSRFLKPRFPWPPAIDPADKNP